MVPADDLPPAARLGQQVEIAAHRQPERLGRPCRQPVAHRGEIEPVQHAAVHRQQLRAVEARPGTGDVAELEALARARPSAAAPDRRTCRAARGRRRPQSARCRRGPGCAATGCRSASRAFRPRRRPAAADGRSAIAPGSPPSASQRSSCSPVLLTWSSPRMICGDPGLEIIDHGGEPVERAPVLADQHRIGHRRQLHLPPAEHEVVPFDRAAGEQEAPVRPLSVGLRRRALLAASASAWRGRRPAAGAGAGASRAWPAAPPRSRSTDRAARTPSAAPPPPHRRSSRSDWWKLSSQSMPSQRRSCVIAASYSGFERSGSVSSMRSTKRPPWRRA